MRAHFSRVQLFATPWTVAHQASLSMEFSRQKYWSGFPVPPPEDLPDPGIKLMSPALTGGFFTTAPPGKSQKLGPHWASHVVLVVKNLPANAGDVRRETGVPSLGQQDPLE